MARRDLARPGRHPRPHAASGQARVDGVGGRRPRRPTASRTRARADEHRRRRRPPASVDGGGPGPRAGLPASSTGAPEEEIDRAEAGGRARPAGRRPPSRPRRAPYTQAEVAAITGMPTTWLRRFWRALGFADVDRRRPDLHRSRHRGDRHPPDDGATWVRPTSTPPASWPGSSAPRWRASPRPRWPRRCDGRWARRAPVDDRAWRPTASPASPPTTPSRPWRGCSNSSGGDTCRPRSAGPCCCAARHGALPVLAVGFADMVGFTMLSQQLSEEELAAVVGRFEDVAHDTVTGPGGPGGQDDRRRGHVRDRVAWSDAARIGLALAEAYADDELLSDVRVGSGGRPRPRPGRRLLRAGGQPGQPDRQHRRPGDGARVRRVPRPPPRGRCAATSSPARAFAPGV